MVLRSSYDLLFLMVDVSGLFLVFKVRFPDLTLSYEIKVEFNAMDGIQPIIPKLWNALDPVPVIRFAPIPLYPLCEFESKETSAMS